MLQAYMPSSFGLCSFILFGSIPTKVGCFLYIFEENSTAFTH